MGCQREAACSRKRRAQATKSARAYEFCFIQLPSPGLLRWFWWPPFRLTNRLAVARKMRSREGRRRISSSARNSHWLGLKVLHGVDLKIGRGETVGIVGKSGSGKTTLGRAVLRLIDIDAGSIVFDGRDISRLPESDMRLLRRRMQMIFQDPMTSLNPRHTVRRILTEPLHGRRRCC
jgi:ABC-type glutathione transport system ATPase component